MEEEETASLSDRVVSFSRKHVTIMAEIISRRTVFTTEWFSIEEKQLTLNSAPHFSLNCPDFVSIVALTRSDELVLVRQFRPAVEEKTLELPSGHIDPGETAVAAAARELSEETGYGVGSLEEMGVLTSDNGRLGNHMHCFFATVHGPSKFWHPEPGLETITFPRAGVLRSIGSTAPILMHAQCLAAIGMAVLQGWL